MNGQPKGRGASPALTEKSMETEIWKDIPGYEDTLQASSLGRIRCKEKGRRRKITDGNIIRARIRDRTGHLSFTIHHTREEQVHRMVAAAFLGPCPEGMMVLHNNGDPADNRPENLRFGNAAENDHDIYRQGGKRRKLDLADVEGIRFGMLAGHTDRQLAWNFDVDISMINRIRNGKRYGWCTA